MADTIYGDRAGSRNANFRGGFHSKCAECATPVWVKPSRAHRSAHYCSQPCANTGKSKRFRGSLASNWSGGGVACVCKVCGVSYTLSVAEKARSGGAFCSRRCAGTILVNQASVVCAHCANEFSVDQHKASSAKFCCRACKHASMTRKRTPEWFAKKRLDARISAAVGITLKRGQKAGRSWRSLVPFTAEQLKQRLLDTMPTGYTWSDFLSGTLEIDHIIPRSAFNYVDPSDYDFQRCWALSNLQLLTAFDNNSKGAKLAEPFQPSLI